MTPSNQLWHRDISPDLTLSIVIFRGRFSLCKNHRPFFSSLSINIVQRYANQEWIPEPVTDVDSWPASSP